MSAIKISVLHETILAYFWIPVLYLCVIQTVIYWWSHSRDGFEESYQMSKSYREMSKHIIVSCCRYKRPHRTLKCLRISFNLNRFYHTWVNFLNSNFSTAVKTVLTKKRVSCDWDYITHNPTAPRPHTNVFHASRPFWFEIALYNMRNITGRVMC